MIACDARGKMVDQVEFLMAKREKASAIPPDGRSEVMAPEKTQGEHGVVEVSEVLPLQDEGDIAN